MYSFFAVLFYAILGILVFSRLTLMFNTNLFYGMRYTILNNKLGVATTSEHKKDMLEFFETDSVPNALFNYVSLGVVISIMCIIGLFFAQTTSLAYLTIFISGFIYSRFLNLFKSNTTVYVILGYVWSFVSGLVYLFLTLHFIVNFDVNVNTIIREFVTGLF